MPNYNGDGLSISWRCLCCRFSVVPLVPHLPGGTRGREAGAELAWVRRPRASPPSGAPSWGPIRASSATKSGLGLGQRTAQSRSAEEPSIGLPKAKFRTFASKMAPRGKPLPPCLRICFGLGTQDCFWTACADVIPQNAASAGAILLS